MSETLEQIKQTIAEAKDLGIINWNTDTIQYLLTTIEQLREEVAHQGNSILRRSERINQLVIENERLQEGLTVWKEAVGQLREERGQAL